MPDLPEATRRDLLLWRHAEAEEGDDDLQRPLTERGRRQAKLMAAWIKAQQPQGLRILVSPAVRTRQTAEALHLPFTIERRLGPGADVPALIAAAGWPQAAGAALLVGHQPTLGRLAALLLAGHEADWSIRKGALWWFSRRLRRDETQTVLRAVIAADMLG
ncbi:MAG: histidine phosphatase family protein [Desulfobulbus sp.]|nr:histidine phosphatase family protein [Desulfobulbus sp.]